MSAPACSFCGKPRSEVRSLVAGHSAFTCNECVESAVEVIATEYPPRGLNAGWIICRASTRSFHISGCFVSARFSLHRCLCSIGIGVEFIRRRFKICASTTAAFSLPSPARALPFQPPLLNCYYPIRPPLVGSRASGRRKAGPSPGLWSIRGRIRGIRAMCSEATA
jgi:hypothetical protein